MIVMFVMFNCLPAFVLTDALLRGGSAVGCWTCDLQVAGSIPSQSAFT